MPIPFSPPRTDRANLDLVNEVLLSGWITTGPKTKEFERRIAVYCGVKKVLCVNSATAGLELALRWFGVAEGDEVIIPAYTYCATANVVLRVGAKPVMIDVNADDFNMSVQRIEEAITERTKAIMPVDISGLPCDYSEIRALVKAKSEIFKPRTEQQKSLGRILVLSDAAHSFGAQYRGDRSGALSDISVFSFHAVKNLTTAEGGAICFNLPDVFDSEELYKTLCIKSLHGQTKDALSKTQLNSWRYDVVEAGFKCNMTDIQAALGLVELERYAETLERRKELTERYNQAFSKYSWAELPISITEDKESAYHLYMLRVKGVSEEQRDQIITEISKAEIACNVHFIPLPMLSLYKGLGYSVENYPNSYSSYANEISLPLYYNLTDEQADTVIDSVSSSIEKVLS